MPSTKLSGKTKADLVVLAELSGLLTASAARKMTKAKLLDFLKEAEQKPSSAQTAEAPPASSTSENPEAAKADAQEVKKARGAKPATAKSTATRKAATTKSAARTKKDANSKTDDTEKKTSSRTARGRKAKAGNAAEKADKSASEPSPEQAEKGTEVKKKSTGSGRTSRRRKVSDKTNEKTSTAAESKQTKREPQQKEAKSNVNLQREIKPDEKTIDRESADETKSKEDNSQKQTSSQNSQNNQNNQNNQKQSGQQNQNGHKANGQSGNKQRRPLVEQGETVSGILEIMSDGYGFLRKDNYLQGNKDIYVPPQYIRRFNLRTGDYVTGPGKLQRDNDRYQALLYVKEVNGMPPDKMIRRPQFDRLTPIYPDERYHLETTRNELSTRIIDLAAPIGKGQRGMIVSPPKAGKTILLQKIANAISLNDPEVKLIVLLIDERPEEVTDMQRSIKGEVVYSTFDKTPENHVKVTELVLERAMRLVELKQDVVILLDSMTRLARAYNLTINPTGRTLSGGLDPGALYGPKRFFGAARNIENGGSLTIISTSLIETGSRMDEVIFEEFKGTGNMEVYLDRKLSEKRIFPAIDINRSGTRREELLMSEKELDAVWTIRKAFSQLDTAAVTETIINLLLKTQNNDHFISSINVSFNDKSIFEAMRGNRQSGNGQNQNNSNGSGR